MISEFKQVTANLVNKQVGDNTILGEYKISTENDLFILQNVLFDYTDGYCKTLGSNISIAECKLGHTYEFKFDLGKLALSGYFLSFSQFFVGNNQVIPIKDFFIEETNDSKFSSVRSQKIQQYYSIIDLIESLRIIADHEIDQIDSYDLVFLDDEKQILSTIYDLKDLTLLIDSNRLRSSLSHSHDKDERAKLFRLAMAEVLKEHSPALRFKSLLEKFKTVYQYYSDSHTLYVTQFSFQRLKNEFDTQRLNYSKRISAIITGIESKILSIPAVYLLILSQFDYVGTKVAKNAGIALSAVIYSVILFLLISNQKRLLSDLEVELTRLKCDLLGRLSQLKDDNVQSDLGKLSDRLTIVKNRIMFIRLLILLIPLLILLLMLDAYCGPIFRPILQFLQGLS